VAAWLLLSRSLGGRTPRVLLPRLQLLPLRCHGEYALLVVVCVCVCVCVFFFMLVCSGRGKRMSFGRGGARVGGGSSRSSTATLAAAHQKLLALSSGRLTSQNMWDADLMTGMEAVMRDKLGDENAPEDSTASTTTTGGGGVKLFNFQRASCTLDASIKVYSCRVDDVLTTSYRVLEAISAGGGGGESDGPKVGLEDDDEEQGGGGRGKRARARRGGEATLSDEASLSLGRESLGGVPDAMLSSLSRAFEEGGSRGLLLRALEVGEGGLLLFDNQEQHSRNAGVAADADSVARLQVGKDTTHLDGPGVRTVASPAQFAEAATLAVPLSDSSDVSQTFVRALGDAALDTHSVPACASVGTLYDQLTEAVATLASLPEPPAKSDAASLGDGGFEGALVDPLGFDDLHFGVWDDGFEDGLEPTHAVSSTPPDARQGPPPGSLPTWLTSAAKSRPTVSRTARVMADDDDEDVGGPVDDDGGFGWDDGDRHSLPGGDAASVGGGAVRELEGAFLAAAGATKGVGQTFDRSVFAAQLAMRRGATQASRVWLRQRPKVGPTSSRRAAKKAEPLSLEGDAPSESDPRLSLAARPSAIRTGSRKAADDADRTETAQHCDVRGMMVLSTRPWVTAREGGTVDRHSRFVELSDWMSVLCLRSAVEATTTVVPVAEVWTSDPDDGGFGWDDGDASDLPAPPGMMLQAGRVVPKTNTHFARRSKKVDVGALKELVWARVTEGAHRVSHEELTAAVESMRMEVRSSRRQDEGHVMVQASTEAELSDAEAVKHGMGVEFSSLVRGASEDADVTVPFYFITLLHLANERGVEVMPRAGLDDVGIVMESE
jgi:condensin complex subunit 2